MKRFTPVALLALLIVPAVAFAAADRFKGGSDDDKKVKIKFELKNEDQIKDFTAKEIEFSCNERDDFRANPPEFTKVDVEKNGDIDQEYKINEKGRNSEGDKVEIRFKGKLEGRLDGKKKKKYDEGDGEMSFDARYKTDGDRCESEELEWDAELKDTKD